MDLISNLPGTPSKFLVIKVFSSKVTPFSMITRQPAYTRRRDRRHSVAAFKFGSLRVHFSVGTASKFRGCTSTALNLIKDIIELNIGCKGHIDNINNNYLAFRAFGRRSSVWATSKFCVLATTPLLQKFVVVYVIKKKSKITKKKKAEKSVYILVQDPEQRTRHLHNIQIPSYNKDIL